jgi:hypothetical protein
MEEVTVNAGAGLSSEAKRSKVRRAFDKLVRHFTDTVNLARFGSQQVVFFNETREVVVKPYYEGNDLRFSVAVLNREGVEEVSSVTYDKVEDVVKAIKVYLGVQS